MPACTESDADDAPDGGKIRLGATVGLLEGGSRTEADPYLGSTPSEANPFASAVWFRVKDDGVYEDNPSGETNLPVHAGVTFTGSKKEFVFHGGENLRFPTDFGTVYCVGLYPDDEKTADGAQNPAGWTLGSDNLSASHPIDGKKDLMFAPQISGKWGSPFDTPLQFGHLLTWVKIAVCATTHDTAEAWGDIEQIRINSRSGLTVDLKTGDVTYAPAAPDQFINTMAPGNPHTLQTTMHEIGSVLVSPETAYTLRIKTKNNAEEREIKLDNLSLLVQNDAGEEALVKVNDPSEARGKCFVLSLYFEPYNVVEVVSFLNAWNNQSEDIYLN